MAAGPRLFGWQHFFDNKLHGIGNHGLSDFGRKVVAELANRPGSSTWPIPARRSCATC